MNRIAAAAIAGLATLALVAGTGAASALDLKVAPPKPKLVPKLAQLGIISPDTCPGIAKINAWVHTNTTGPVTILVVEKEGAVFGPFTVDAVKGSGGTYLATYSGNLPFDSDFYAQYRVVVPGTTVKSNWVTLDSDC